jgi:hypothetical protein
MLVEGPLDMELVAALIVRRGIAQIEGHADRARNFGSCLPTEESISPLDIDARPVEAHYGKTVGGIMSGRGEPGQCYNPMMLAGFPAETRAVGAISDGDYRIRPIELAIESQGADERNRCGIRVGADRNGRGKAECAAENLDIGVQAVAAIFVMKLTFIPAGRAVSQRARSRTRSSAGSTGARRCSPRPVTPM